MRFRSITFEMSLKPFTDDSDGTMDAVCRRLFTQWLALCREGDSVAVMLWAADGSEILDYRGSLADRFEWAKWQGVANPHGPPRRPTPPASIWWCRPPRWAWNPAIRCRWTRPRSSPARWWWTS